MLRISPVPKTVQIDGLPDDAVGRELVDVERQSRRREQHEESHDHEENQLFTLR